jgi:hypothetical protein
MLSHKLVLSESENFTSGHSILAPPTIPIPFYQALACEHFRSQDYGPLFKTLRCKRLVEEHPRGWE